jgi:isopenicillin N synthase-like dioxygenase
MEIAIIDAHSPDAPQAFSRALIDTGFTVLANHPIDPAVLVEVRQAWMEFFASSDAVKNEYIPPVGAQDGFHPLSESETAVGAQVRDLKEFFHWYPWGRTPASVAEPTRRLFDAAAGFATTLLGWLAATLPAAATSGLEVPLPDLLDNARRTMLRVAHYPPLPDELPLGAMRAAPHEDVNLLTVLPASDQAGLQVLDRLGVWLDVPNDPGTVTINAGDMLQLLTGGVIRSGTHRVVNPQGVDARQGRLSTPLFLHPTDDAVLAPGVTAFAFLRDRIREIRGIDLTPS